MTPRPGSTEAAVADAVAHGDVRAATGAPQPPAGGAGGAGGPGSADPLVAGLRKAGLLPLLVLHLLGDGTSYGNQLMERISDLTGGLKNGRLLSSGRGRSTPAAGQAQQHHEQVDEVEIERQRCNH